MLMTLIPSKVKKPNQADKTLCISSDMSCCFHLGLTFGLCRGTGLPSCKHPFPMPPGNSEEDHNQATDDTDKNLFGHIFRYADH